jgi:hypothetical protein
MQLQKKLPKNSIVETYDKFKKQQLTTIPIF